MDTMVISGLRCPTHIGCTAEERALPQLLLVTLTLSIDIRPAAESDELEEAVNYAHLSREVLAACDKTTCKLIETLAEKLAALCLDFSMQIHAATVEIRKQAGMPNGDYAAIIITRERKQ